MVENVLHSKKLERQSNEKNVVRRITPLNHVNPVPQVNPGGVQELPEQRARVFPNIPDRSASFWRRGMSVDTDSVDNFISFGRCFPSRTQHRHFISILSKGTRFSPNTTIEGNRLVL